MRLTLDEWPQWSSKVPHSHADLASRLNLGPQGQMAETPNRLVFPFQQFVPDASVSRTTFAQKIPEMVELGVILVGSKMIHFGNVDVFSGDFPPPTQVGTRPPPIATDQGNFWRTEILSLANGIAVGENMEQDLHKGQIQGTKQILP